MKRGVKLILRHLTTSDKFHSILKDGVLKGSNNLRNTHNGHVSFEEFNREKDERAFVKGFALTKGVRESEVIQLLFDGTKMVQMGIEIRDSFINGTKDSKIELGYFISDEELESVGDYRFVFGEVPLDFLLEQPKMDF